MTKQQHFSCKNIIASVFLCISMLATGLFAAAQDNFAASDSLWSAKINKTGNMLYATVNAPGIPGSLNGYYTVTKIPYTPPHSL